MKTSKIVYSLIVILSCIFLFVACGKNTKKSKETNSTIEEKEIIQLEEEEIAKEIIQLEENIEKEEKEIEELLKNI